jgi:general secretion pathway protein A
MFPQSALDPYWLGDFILLWRPPALKNRLLMKGMTGSDVLWLKAQLDRLKGVSDSVEEGASRDLFDDDLRKRVMGFQRTRALPMDGIVGEETLLELTRAVDSHTFPSLSERKG